jgi:hypothetical protein
MCTKLSQLHFGHQLYLLLQRVRQGQRHVRDVWQRHLLKRLVLRLLFIELPELLLGLKLHNLRQWVRKYQRELRSLWPCHLP